MFFKHIEAAPADPILGLGEAFKAETRPEKVNLGIGVYKDASGATPIVKADGPLREAFPGKARNRSGQDDDATR